MSLTQAKLAEMAHVSQQTIQKIEASLIKIPRNIEIYAELLNVSPEWLMFGTENTPESRPVNMREAWNQKDPNWAPVLEWNELIQWLTASAPALDMDPKTRDFVPNPLIGQPHRKHVFAVRVQNDAMAPPTGNTLTFQLGTILIVDPYLCKNVKSGNYVVGYRPGTTDPLFRQFIAEGGKMYLKPLNPQYPTEEIDSTFMVLGVVIARLDALV